MYGKFTRRQENECNQRCKGNNNQFCGGGWRNSIYKTGVVGKSKKLKFTLKQRKYINRLKQYFC